MAITLRPRQVKAVEDIQRAYRAGFKAPILVMPTGGGKTATASVIMQMAIARGKRVWFLAHLDEILKATAAKLRAEGIPYGWIAADMPGDRKQAVQVVSVFTLVNRLDRYDPPDFLIVDEAHLAVGVFGHLQGLVQCFVGSAAAVDGHEDFFEQGHEGSPWAVAWRRTRAAHMAHARPVRVPGTSTAGSIPRGPCALPLPRRPFSCRSPHRRVCGSPHWPSAVVRPFESLASWNTGSDFWGRCGRWGFRPGAAR